jgi:hypothetical protein
MRRGITLDYLESCCKRVRSYGRPLIRAMNSVSELRLV